MTPAAAAPNPVQPAVLLDIGQTVVEEAQEAQAEVRAANALEAEAEDLRPGQFVWRPERAERGPVEVVVSIERQMAYVYRAGTLIGVSTVSTGRRGHSTPTGSFTILQKNRRHFSNLYNNAPMPNMQRLTWGGIALHAGALPGYPASHGCVRLPMEFSRLLFGVTSLGGASTSSRHTALSAAALSSPPASRTACDGLAAKSAAALDGHARRIKRSEDVCPSLAVRLPGSCRAGGKISDAVLRSSASGSRG